MFTEIKFPYSEEHKGPIQFMYIVLEGSETSAFTTTTPRIENLHLLSPSSPNYRFVTLDQAGRVILYRISIRNKFGVYKSFDPIVQSPLLSFEIGSNVFAMTKDARILFSGGNMDNSFRVLLLDQPNNRQHYPSVAHKGRVTCISLSENDKYLVTGSEDTTLHLWELNDIKKNPRSTILKHILHVLYGHTEPVSCVVVSEDLNIVISGSLGLCIIHNLSKGEYVRHIRLKGESIDLVTLDPLSGHFIMYSKTSLCFRLYTINGRLLIRKDTNEHIHTMFLSHDGNYIITGGNKNRIVVRSLHQLEIVNKKHIGTIHSMAMFGDKFMALGLDKEFSFIFRIKGLEDNPEEVVKDL